VSTADFLGAAAGLGASVLGASALGASFLTGVGFLTGAGFLKGQQLPLPDDHDHPLDPA
jgi:hypothetical protein